MSAQNWSRFYEAMRTGNCDTMRELVATAGINPNGHSPAFFQHGGALHRAVMYGASLDVIVCLIDCGADVNARGYKGYTPLHFAASKGADDIMTLLVANGADASLLSDDDKTADQVYQRMNSKPTVVAPAQTVMV